MPDSREAADPRDAARGRWLEVLTGLGQIDSSYLSGNHGPCPFCGGKDRWRWDDREGSGSGYCNQCGGPGQAGGNLTGVDLLMRARDWPFATAMKELRAHLGIEGGAPVRTTSVQRPQVAHKPKPPAVKAPPVLVEEPQPPIPVEEIDVAARQFLKMLGKSPATARLRAFYHGEDPRKGTDRGKKAAYSAAEIAKWQDDGRGVYFVVNDGGDADKEITGCRAFFCEFDDRPRDEQTDFWRDLGLPEPTVQVDTGGKSIHSYWVLEEPIGAAEWKRVQTRLLDYVDADRTLKNPSRVMRLPGPRYAIGKDKLGEQCRVLRSSGITYRADEIEAEMEHPNDLLINSKLGDGAPSTKKGKAKDEWPFTLLGFAGNDYYYQPGDSGQVLSIAGGQGHSPANLIRLADLGWWEDQFPRYNAEGERMGGANWQDAWNTICRRQHEVGVYDPRRIRGLGAWWDDGRVVYHLGDRLIIGGAVVPVLEAAAGRYLYQRLPRKDGPGDVAAMTADEGLGLALLAERFRWDASASARLLMGWIALAPIAGALEWRPHAWISGVSGSGKTTVVNMVVLPLLGDMALFALGNTTEAGLRQTLKSDSLPVVFDEAESNRREDAARMQNVLALARAASAETGAHQYKGSARGEAMMFEIRSMFMMSSINSALKEGADRSRFSSLLLRSAVGDDTERWEALERDIALACTKETGKRLIARMVQLVPMVRQVAVQMVRVVAMELKGGARMGQQVGTLLAGYWCLCNDQPPTEEEALALVRDVDWEEHGGSGDERGGDQGDLLATLLEARLTVESGTARHSLTVKELCLISSGTVTDMNLDPNAARMELGRNGMLAKGGRLYVAYRSKGIERILRDTPWAVGGWKNLLLAVTGADKHDPMRFPAVETTIRAVSVPLG